MNSGSKRKESTYKMNYFWYMVAMSSIFVKLTWPYWFNSLLKIHIKLFSVERINFLKKC